MKALKELESRITEEIKGLNESMYKHRMDDDYIWFCKGERSVLRRYLELIRHHIREEETDHLSIVTALIGGSPNAEE